MTWSARDKIVPSELKYVEKRTGINNLYFGYVLKAILFIISQIWSLLYMIHWDKSSWEHTVGSLSCGSAYNWN